MSMEEPVGLSLDYVAGRLYWISEYKEVGTGGGRAQPHHELGGGEVGVGRAALLPLRHGVPLWHGVPVSRRATWRLRPIPSPSRRCGWMAAGATPSPPSCGATPSRWAWPSSRAASSGPMAPSWWPPAAPLPGSTPCCCEPPSRLSPCCTCCSSLRVSTAPGSPWVRGEVRGVAAARAPRVPFAPRGYRCLCAGSVQPPLPPVPRAPPGLPVCLPGGPLPPALGEVCR